VDRILGGDSISGRGMKNSRWSMVVREQWPLAAAPFVNEE
jgi:hypothetical protein